MFESYVRGCCVKCHSLFFIIYKTFEESMQSEHLYLLFGISANLSKIFSPYLMRFEENFALSHQVTAFLLLKLAQGQIVDLNEMLQLATVSHLISACQLHEYVTIDLNSVSCDPPTLGHMSRYHEAYIRENIFQLPSLTRLCLSEISAFGGFPSIPHLLSISEDRFKSSLRLPVTFQGQTSSCSRMDTVVILYLYLYEIQQSQRRQQILSRLSHCLLFQYQRSDVASGLLYSLKIELLTTLV